MVLGKRSIFSIGNGANPLESKFTLIVTSFSSSENLRLSDGHISWIRGNNVSEREMFQLADKAGFIQAILSKIQGIFKDF